MSKLPDRRLEPKLGRPPEEGKRAERPRDASANSGSIAARSWSSYSPQRSALRW